MQHVQLLEALQERDADRAEAVTREHIATALKAILARPEILADDGGFPTQAPRRLGHPYAESDSSAEKPSAGPPTSAS